MSHELRTPLATIRTAAHNIASGVVREPGQVREYATMVQNEGRRLSAMVDHVIQFAQAESGRRRYVREPVRLGPVVERALTITFSDPREARRIVETRIAEGIPDALGDETALTHALVNLLSNAVKYGTGKNGEAVRLEIESETDGKEIRISVVDDGPGIPPEDLGQVFEPYYRGKNANAVPGSGLGLSLVKKMIEGQGGRVTVSSTPGRGTTFTLHIAAAGGGGGPGVQAGRRE
jgi:two-component system phosphate regulon sensor histidine kinase PhoR